MKLVAPLRFVVELSTDTFHFRYSLNMIAAAFITVGTLWDVGTWYYSKDVRIFDEEEEAPIELAQNSSEIQEHKK